MEQLNPPSARPRSIIRLNLLLALVVLIVAMALSGGVNFAAGAIGIALQLIINVVLGLLRLRRRPNPYLVSAALLPGVVILLFGLAVIVSVVAKMLQVSGSSW